MKQPRKHSDTEIKLSYDVMNALRDSIFLSSYVSNEYGLGNRLVIRLMFTTKDGKIHQIANTDVAL